MKKLICLLILIVSVKILYAQDKFQGDLSFKNVSQNDISVIVESETIPFEGNNWVTSPQNNRNTIIQNGNTYRRYSEPPSAFSYDEWQIAKHEFSVNNINQYDLVHCSQNVNTNGLKTYGFAKYLITISYQNNITHKFYFNTLDSKYTSEVNGITYGNDFYIKFFGADQQIDFYGAFGHRYIDPYNSNNPIPEMKVWELIYNTSEPLGTDFYVHSTPFGYCYKQTQDYLDSYRTEVLVGPHVILDAVYPYSVVTKFGYNTMLGQTSGYDFYYTPPIPANQNDQGNTYVTPSIFVTPNQYGSAAGTNFIAEAGNIFDLRENKKFWISSEDIAPDIGITGDALTFKKNSHLILGANAKIQTCRMGKFIDEGSIKEFNSGNILRAWGSTQNNWSYLSEIQFTGNNETHIINNGARVEIDAYATLTVGNNTTLIFDGQNTCLQLKSGSHINLGTNASLVFQNGAYLDATNITFACQNSGNYWGGINLLNAGSMTVSDCTFSDCQTPIRIINDALHGNYSKVFQNNTFTLTGNVSDRAIYAENIFSLNAHNNTFNLGTSSIGIFIKNSGNTTGTELGGNSNNININYNAFNYGTISLIMANYASSLPDFMVDGNTFNNNSYINILGRMMGGNIINNVSNNNNTTRSLHFTQSNPNIYNNTFYASNNILVGSESSINLTSTKTQNGLVWYGGRNNMTASSLDNLNYNYGFANLDNGENVFIKNSGSAYHLYGVIDLSQNPYYVRNNCFNANNPPSSLLWDKNNNPINPISQGSTFNCNSTSNGIGWLVRDIGFEQYDSVLITALPPGEQLTPEEILYSQAINSRNTEDYYNAISDYKSFINLYPSSSNIISSLYDLYSCYERGDTITEQSNKDIFYGNLITFLNDKISSQNYDAEFNHVAYNLTLSCYAKMTEYNTALDGYEFISLFHPNPEVRLLASWDYEEIEAILNSGGGLSSKYEKMTTEDFYKNRIARMKALISKDPIKDKVKKSYDKLSKKRDDFTKKSLEKLTKSYAEIKMQQLKSEDNKLINKAVSNLRSLRGLKKEEKEKRQLEDLLLSTGIKPNEQKSRIGSENNIPMTFELSQNYPNPFNPVTNIKYQIPKDIMVSVKVYDMLGRELKTLVNEFKKAGSYLVSFNGGEFASGVYFYRIQAGNFVQVKRMVLIK